MCVIEDIWLVLTAVIFADAPYVVFVVQSISAEKSTVSVPEKLVAGIDLEFQVSSRDVCGNPCSKGTALHSFFILFFHFLITL